MHGPLNVKFTYWFFRTHDRKACITSISMGLIKDHLNEVIFMLSRHCIVLFWIYQENRTAKLKTVYY